MRLADKLSLFVLVALLALSTACNRMATPPQKQVLKDADAKAANGDFLEAISLYERMLDGSAASAEVHYKIALLYDDKMNDPVHALHHFKRYLTLAPSGPRAAEVKEFMKRDELAIATALSGDSVVSRAEAARLKNENLNLRKQLDERAAQLKAATESAKTAARATKAEKSSSSEKRKRSGRRSDVVRSE